MSTGPDYPAPPPATPPRAPLGERDWVRRTVIVLTLVNTILAAVVAGLEVDASTRADEANRTSQALAIQGTALLLANGEAAGYESSVVADVLRHQQESLVQGYSALEVTQEGDTAAARELQAQEQVSAARATRASELSEVFTDPRYAPPADAEVPLPDLEAWLSDLNDGPNALVVQQNAAADEYSEWDSRSSTYVAILSILAVAFFLLGLAQVRARMRVLLAATASALMAACALWTVLVAVG
ncbi:MAG: hypothetical protein R2737_10170 [Candidatus Nanopelagicales bacterium]